MQDVIIKRSYTPLGTIGTLTVGQFVCHTLERPNLQNARNISCIPEGEYICRVVDSPKFGRTFEVTNVKNRSHILFHALNRVHESMGCIGIGDHVSINDDDWFISNSRRTFQKFMREVGDDTEFKLIITAQHMELAA